MAPITPYTGPITAKHQTAWLRAATEYKRLHALMQADFAFGPTKRADEEHDRERIAIEQSDDTPERAKERLSRAYHRQQAVCDRQCEALQVPANTAAILLVTTPAPTLEDAIGKIEIVKAYELANDRDFPGEPFDFIAADLARFAPGGAA